MSMLLIGGSEKESAHRIRRCRELDLVVSRIKMEFTLNGSIVLDYYTPGIVSNVYTNTMYTQWNHRL